DEFIVALPETTVEQAETVAAKLRQVAIPPLKSSAGLPPIRLSVGLAWNQREEWTSQDILNAADASLYEAKRDVYRKRSRAESVRAST
ncbi:MAG TPA: diguanylate cyclase, partial [bacterium]